MMIIPITRDTSREIAFALTQPNGTTPFDLAGYVLTLRVSWAGGSTDYSVGSGLSVTAPNIIRWRFSEADSLLFPVGQIATWRMIYDAAGLDRDLFGGMLNVTALPTYAGDVTLTVPGLIGVTASVAGPQGASGWTASVALVVDGARRVYQVADWVGGGGTKPAVGQFIGPLGFVSTAALATDVSGGIGPQSAIDAAASAAAALASQNAAATSAGNAAGDRTQTGLDRTQTGLDRVATGQDRTQTGLDRTAVSTDRGLAQTAATSAVAADTAIETRFAASEGFSGAPGSLFDIWWSRNLYSRREVPTTRAVLITFTRSTVAEALDPQSVGLLPQVSTDVPRIDSRGYLAEQPVDAQPVNPLTTGGSIGSPGTPPTGWGFTTSLLGLTRSIVNIGTINGFPFVDFEYSGTTTGATDDNTGFTGNIITAANGQTWTGSFFIQLISGSMGSGTVQSRIEGRDGGGTLLEASNGPVITPSGLLQRVPHTRTMTNAGTARVSHRVLFALPNATALTFRPRVIGPMLNPGQLTSPVLTGPSAPITRAGDVLSVSVPVTGIAAGGDWTLAGVARMPTTPANAVENIIGIAIDASNRFFLRRDGSTGLEAAAVVAGTAQTGRPVVTAPAAGALFGWALRRSGGNLGLSINGGTPVNATPAAMPTGAPVTVAVAHNMNGGGQLNARTSRTILFPSTVNDATLQNYSTTSFLNTLGINNA